MKDHRRSRDFPNSYRPTTQDVDDLVRRAAGHPLGTDFLANGAPDAVAATFGVHAFVVDAARETLGAAAPAENPATRAAALH